MKIRLTKSTAAAALLLLLPLFVAPTLAQPRDLAQTAAGGGKAEQSPPPPLVITLEDPDGDGSRISPSVSFATLDDAGRLVGRGSCRVRKGRRARRALAVCRRAPSPSVSDRVTAERGSAVRVVTVAVP